MSLIVDVAADGVRAPIAQARIRDIAVAVLRAERVRDALVSITFVSRQHIARLNRTHLGHAGPTDVISFALGALPGRTTRHAVVGDIYIAPDVARANADRLGRGVREEVARLVVHGTLHVLGHDHPDGDDRTTSPMWRRQERLLASIGKRARTATPPKTRAR
jgi:probable rRNA maturation factor